MTRFRSIAFASALGILVCAAAVSGAAQHSGEPPAEVEKPPEALLEGLTERLLSTMRALLDKIPQYEMPEFTEDGDIVIRRKRPEEDAPGLTGEGEITEL